MDPQSAAIALNDQAHDSLVHAIVHRLGANAGLRQLLMSAMERAEEAWVGNPKANTERVIALVNLDLFSRFSEAGGQVAYARAIQDALDATGQAFDGSESRPIDITRFAYMWYTLGFQQQALGQAEEAIRFYQLATQTAMVVPGAQRDLRLLILAATNTAACADDIGLSDLADDARRSVDDLLRKIERG